MTLGMGNMQVAVEVPKGEDLNEWLAVNTIEFYNEISILYGILVEFCTTESCPIMSAGPKYGITLIRIFVGRWPQCKDSLKSMCRRIY